MAAFFAEIARERVARPHHFQSRVFFELGLRDDRARVGLRGRVWQSLAAAVPRSHLINRALVIVVLQREVLAPDGGVFSLVCQFHYAIERVSRLLLALEDVDEQRRDAYSRERGN